VIFKSFDIGFQQPKYSLGIQRAHARRSQADYKAFLPVYQAAGFGKASFDTAEVVLEIQKRLTQYRSLWSRAERCNSGSRDEADGSGAHRPTCRGDT
jgi:hypothetical protein